MMTDVLKAVLYRALEDAQKKVDPLEQIWLQADENEKEARENLHQAKGIVYRISRAIDAMDGCT